MMTSTATKRPNRIKKARVDSSFHVFELNYPEITWGSTSLRRSTKRRRESIKTPTRSRKTQSWNGRNPRSGFLWWFSHQSFLFHASFSFRFSSLLHFNPIRFWTREYSDKIASISSIFFSLKRKVSVSRFEKKRNCSPVLCEFEISHSIICIWYFWFCFRSLIACFRFELQQEFEDYLIDVLIVIIKLQRD